MNLELDNGNELPLNKAITLSGWALTNGGVDVVDFWIKDENSGTSWYNKTVNLNKARTDVTKIYRDYISGDICGFEHQILFSTKGKYTITAYAMKNGKVVAQDSATIYVGETYLGEKVVEYAKTFLGTPYKWGGKTPEGGFDCSGLVQYVYAHFGIQLTGSTYDQIKMGVEVSKSNLKPGDLVFFNSAGHVGIYVGNNNYIHAPRTGDVVKISSLSSRSDYYTARRVIKKSPNGDSQ